MLTAEQRERYSRHLVLPEIGEEGQQRLCDAHVAVVGLGGLGSPIALYLAAAGVGTLTLIDGDVVDLTNLQRQIVHSTTGVGKQKVDSAARSLTALNPGIRVLRQSRQLDDGNADELLGKCDFVVDATDNFRSKFLIADVCHRLKLPYSHGGVCEFFGQSMTVLPGTTACYRCVFERPPDAMGSTPRGPLGVVPGVIGTIQATEVIKYLLDLGELLTNALLSYDALTMTFRKINIRPNAACRLCGR